MSPQRGDIPEPTERLYAPRPSRAPAVFAFAAALAVCGIFIKFMLSGWTYSLIGVVVLLAAFRSMTRGAVRAHLRLPRRQKARGAALPVETIEFPPS